MTRTATGAVLASSLAIVLGTGFGSVSFAQDDDPVVPASTPTAEISRVADLQVAMGTTPREQHWEHQRVAEAAAREEAARRRARVRTAAASSATPVDLQGYLGQFTITCYSLRGTTASGRPAGPGIVAVDPRVIPMGSRIAIEGLGAWTAGDTGGKIKGKRLDIWMSSTSDCVAFGRQVRNVWSA